MNDYREVIEESAGTNRQYKEQGNDSAACECGAVSKPSNLPNDSPKQPGTSRKPKEETSPTLEEKEMEEIQTVVA